MPTYTSNQFVSTLSYGSMPNFYWNFPDGLTLNITTTQGMVYHWFTQVYPSPVTLQLNVSNQVSQQNYTVCIYAVRRTESCTLFLSASANDGLVLAKRKSSFSSRTALSITSLGHLVPSVSSHYCTYGRTSSYLYEYSICNSI